jgi:hypothetical protein
MTNTAPASSELTSLAKPVLAKKLRARAVATEVVISFILSPVWEMRAAELIWALIILLSLEFG